MPNDNIGQNLIDSIEKIPQDKELIVFDLDGTLAESKTPIDDEMAELLAELIKVKKVAVIGGGKFELFQTQLLDGLKDNGQYFGNLFLFPVTSTSFYRYIDDQWKCVYSINLSEDDKKKVNEAFEKLFDELNYHPDDTYWKVVEDRGSEITFSALGQNAPLDIKTAWKKDHDELRLKMVKILQGYLPEMEVRVAGLTSIDITLKGIDKEYGLNKIKEYLNISFEEMVFIGDAIFKDGNDYAALRTGVLSYKVNGVEDTKKIIRHLLS